MKFCRDGDKIISGHNGVVENASDVLRVRKTARRGRRIYCATAQKYLWAT
jgi:hypothetical protein